MATLESRIKDYIKENSKETGSVNLPLSQIAKDIGSSTATIWRGIQRLERKRVVKVIRPSLKTLPNELYYLGEEDELNDIIDEMMLRSANLIILMKELKDKIKEKDNIIFSLKQEIEKETG